MENAYLDSIPAPTEFVDLDARGSDYFADAVLRTRQAYFKANCPAAYKEFDPSHPNIQGNRDSIDKILAWQMTEGGKGILATGKTGRGKTRAMYALCKRLLCDDSKDVAMWHAKDWFTELQANVRYGQDEASHFVKRTAERRILFIDDYGQEALLHNREDWATGWFFRMLDMRIGAGLPLLMTTNLTSKQMAEGSSDIASDPLVRRVMELCEPLKFL